MNVVDSSRPLKKKRKWQFHYKWKRKRKEEFQSDQALPESDSLKRPKRNDPDDAGEESPDPVPQTAEDEPNNANSIPTTQNFFPIFSRKPLIYFKANPPKFSSHEVWDPPKKKTKSKAKKVQKKTETTSKTKTLFLGNSCGK